MCSHDLPAAWIMQYGSLLYPLVETLVRKWCEKFLKTERFRVKN